MITEALKMLKLSEELRVGRCALTTAGRERTANTGDGKVSLPSDIFLLNLNLLFQEPHGTGIARYGEECTTMTGYGSRPYKDEHYVSGNRDCCIEMGEEITKDEAECCSEKKHDHENKCCGLVGEESDNPADCCTGRVTSREGPKPKIHSVDWTYGMNETEGDNYICVAPGKTCDT